MSFDYFYGPQAKQFSFYRIPKVLFTDERFRDISTDAKTLYGILLDRMELSARNGWTDEEGRVYIIFTIEEIMEALSCGNKKASALLSELEKKAGLIERRRQGLCKPNLIYVKNFIGDHVDYPVDNMVDRHSWKCQKDTSGSVEMTSLEMSKRHGNNTDMKDTDYSLDFLPDRLPGSLHRLLHLIGGKVSILIQALHDSGSHVINFYSI